MSPAWAVRVVKIAPIHALVWRWLLVALEPLGSSTETGACVLHFQEYLLFYFDKCPSREPFKRLTAG